MNSSFSAVISDVCGMLPVPYPDDFQKMANGLYNSSKLKIHLKPMEEIARLHICVMLTALHFQDKYHLTNIKFDNAPVSKDVVSKLIALFQKSLYFEPGSNSTTPFTTPKKRKASKQSTPATPSPTKNKGGRPPGSRNKSTLTQRLESLSSQQDDADVPENFLNANTTKSSPIKTPRKSSPRKTPFSASNSPSKPVKLLSAGEITILCNKFQMEQPITENILETFKQYYTKVSNEWILLCGLILNCYFVKNHKILKEKVGSKNQVIRALFKLQNGGLMLDQINTSVSIVRDLIIHSKWFKELKLQHDYPLDEQNSTEISFGDMITRDVQYHSQENVKAYNDWVLSIKSQIAGRV